MSSHKEEQTRPLKLGSEQSQRNRISNIPLNLPNNMYPNEGITEHAHTSRYVPAQGRGPFFGIKDKLHLYNKNWPYPSSSMFASATKRSEAELMQ